MDIIPKKCCIKYTPPTLILFYEMKETGKLHRRSIPIRTIEDDSVHENILENLMSEDRHSKYLKQFQQKQLQRLLRMLTQKNTGLKFELNENEADNQGVDVEKTDLNKLDDENLNKVKEKMNESFEQNKVKPGDGNWKYDIEVDFEKQGQIESSAWDDADESDMEF